LSPSGGLVLLDVYTSAGDSQAKLTIPTEPDAGVSFPGFLSVGAQSVQPTNGPFTVLYDNVVVHWK